MSNVGANEVLLIMVVLGFILGGLLLAVIPYWRLCQRVGFPGVLSLLMIVPIANIILPFYIAFAEWPAFRDREL